jgi:hypothetical protein
MEAEKNQQIPIELAEGAFGPEQVGWEVKEYRRYERGRLWHVLMALAGVGLLIYTVASANFLFALIIMMFALIIYISSVVEPRTVRFGITDTGVRFGKTMRRFRDASRFWMIYEPPEVKSLYIEFKGATTPRMVVDLGEMNPNEVRTVLGQFVREDLEEDVEPFADFVGRVLKI